MLTILLSVANKITIRKCHFLQNLLMSCNDVRNDYYTVHCNAF